MKFRPRTTSQLMELYHVSRTKFNTWLSPHLEEIGKRKGYFWTARQVQMIFERLGPPDGKDKFQ